MNAQPDLSRRAFFTALPAVTAGLAVPAHAADEANPHWSMLIDTRRCIACQACTTKYIAATNHHSHLDTQTSNRHYLVHHANNGVSVDAKLVIPHQSLTRKFQQDSFVGRQFCGHGVLSYGQARRAILLLSGLRLGPQQPAQPLLRQSHLLFSQCLHPPRTA